MTWLGAGLPNIDSAGAGREQPLQLIVLFPVGGIHINVQTQLAGLELVSLAEDDRGLRAVEADARGPDIYACFLTPEPRQQFGITCVQDQFGYATCHLMTIKSHAADSAIDRADERTMAKSSQARFGACASNSVSSGLVGTDGPGDGRGQAVERGRSRPGCDQVGGNCGSAGVASVAGASGLAILCVPNSDVDLEFWLTLSPLWWSLDFGPHLAPTLDA